jgi:hypothetical protein
MDVVPADAITAQIRSDLAEIAKSLVPEPETEESAPDEGDALVTPPSSAEFLRARAFLVLAHAAIEELIEETISTAVRDCLAEPDVPPPAIALPLTAKYADEVIGQNSGRVPPPRTVLSMLHGLFYSKVIKPNNGIRPSSLEKICKPLGIDIYAVADAASVDPALAALDTLGAKRGGAAHTFLGAVDQENTPEQVREYVTAGLDLLDRLLPALIEEIGTRSIIATTVTPATG